MTSWPTVRLSEVLTDVEPGFACGKGKHVPAGVAHLRPFNIGGDLDLRLDQVYRVPETEAPRGKVGLVAGDVLFNNTNSADQVGKVAYVGRKMEAGFSNHVTRLRFQSDRMEPAFAAAVLHRLWRRRYFERRSTRWVSQAAFNTRALRELQIPLPPLDEQRRIVDILNRANGLRRLRREALDKARQLIPALFVDMFGDPASNPKGWPDVTLGSALNSIEGGWSPKCHDRQPGPGEWGVLKLSAVTSGRFRSDQCKTLPVDGKPRPDLEVKPGDLLFTRKNTHELVAAAALVQNTPPQLLLPDLIFRLQIDPKCPLLSEYLWACLMHPNKRRQTQALAGGSADSMPNISKKRLRSAKLPLPPLILQQDFAFHVADIQATIAQQERMAEASEQLVAALMARLFDGAAAKPDALASPA